MPTGDNDVWVSDQGGIPGSSWQYLGSGIGDASTALIDPLFPGQVLATRGGGICRVDLLTSTDGQPPTPNNRASNLCLANDANTGSIQNYYWGVQIADSVIDGGSGGLVISSEGITALSAHGTDNAGNDEAGKTMTFRIDETPPIVSVTGITNGGVDVLDAAPAAGCTTSDALSGVVTNAGLSITGGTSNGLGTFLATCSGAVDKAGNQAASVSFAYTQRYIFRGFFSPVTMNALNMASAGQSIAMKWQLAGSDGSLVSSLSSLSAISSEPMQLPSVVRQRILDIRNCWTHYTSK